MSDGDVQNIEFKDAKLNDVIPEAQKQSLYKKFLAPLIGSIYQLGKNEKTVFLKKSELGLSFVLQAYGVAGASKTGGGKLLGLGIDLGFDTKTNRLFASIYTTNGKFSAAASLPDAGFNLSGGFRSETSPDQTSLIKDYLLFDKMNISLQKQQRDPTKTTFTGIIPYTVISGEYNKQYANITGGLGMTLNPMPGLAEFDTDSKGYKLYIGNPLVLLNPEYLGMNSLVETWQKYFSTKPRFASCHSIY